MKTGTIILLTGLPCSGKSTIAEALSKEINATRIDGDELRELWPGLGYSKVDRDENISRLSIICTYLKSKGVNVIASFIAPYKEARAKIGADVMVYVYCPLDVCIKRDTKGLYNQAIYGRIKNFTGISAPYEEPGPDEYNVLVNTSVDSVEESILRIIGYINDTGSFSHS